jgi:predicted adenylyl cyclase CyaB
MNRNIEIKARLRDAAACEQRARALAGPPARVMAQEDVFFACERGRLKLRRQDDDPGELIAYQRPDVPGLRTSQYRIHRTAEMESLAATLAMALGETGRVRKQRQLYLVGQTRIHIDRVEGLGAFLELEVVLAPQQSEADGEAVAHDLMATLGIDAADLVAGAYVDLLEQRGDQA